MGPVSDTRLVDRLGLITEIIVTNRGMTDNTATGPFNMQESQVVGIAMERAKIKVYCSFFRGVWMSGWHDNISYFLCLKHPQHIGEERPGSRTFSSEIDLTPPPLSGLTISL